MSTKFVVRPALALGVAIAAAISSQAYASGFALNEQSVAGMGTAYAGRAAGAANDASVVHGNPAAMSLLKRPEIVGGITYIKAKTDISVNNSTDSVGNSLTDGNDKGDIVPDQYIPYFYYVNPVSDKVAIGMGIYVPFGLATEYDDNHYARNFALDSDIVTVNFQPTISYKINEQWSVGGGIYASYIDAKLSNKKEMGAMADLHSEVTGHDWSWGYTLGALYQPTDKTRLGLTYHSKTKYTLEGQAKIKGSSFLGPITPVKGDGHVDVTTPESVDFAISHELTDRWTVMAGATWTRWSRFDEVNIIADESITVLTSTTNPGETLTYVKEDWKDVWAYSIGASYKVNEQWLVRAGYAIDESPVSSDHVTARIPSGDRQWLTLGAQWKADENFTVDMALGYLWEDKVKVNEHLYDASTKQPVAGTNYSAKYDNSGIGVGIQVGYKF